MYLPSSSRKSVSSSAVTGAISTSATLARRRLSATVALSFGEFID